MSQHKSEDVPRIPKGVSFRFFGRNEWRELLRVLNTDERVLHGVFGYYHGGSGILVTTTHRILLVDKRPLLTHSQILAYHYVHSVHFVTRFMQATILIKSNDTDILFRSVQDAKLSKMCTHIKDRVAEIATYGFAMNTTESSSYRRHPAWRPHAPYMTRLKPTKYMRNQQLPY